jgi:serine phosphatase RsbU (regulator of sigma subunit)
MIFRALKKKKYFTNLKTMWFSFLLFGGILNFSFGQKLGKNNQILIPADSLRKSMKKIEWQEMDEEKAKSIMNQADALEKERDLKAALKLYFSLQNHFERTENQASQTQVLLKIARLYENQNIPERAIDFYGRALIKINAHQLSQFSKNEILVKIGEGQTDVGKYSQAEHSFLEALKTEKLIKGDLYLTILNHLAQLYREQKQVQSLLRISVEILDYQKTHGASRFLALAYNNVGFVYKSMGDLRMAQNYFNQALESESANPNQDYHNLLSIRINLASVLNQEKKYHQANVELQKALNLAQSKHDLFYQADIQNFIALIKFNLQDYQNAFLICKRACEDAEKIRKKDIRLRCFKTYSLILEKLGDYQEALKYQKLQSLLQDSLFQEENTQNQEKLFNRLQVERTEKELKLLLLDAEKSEFEYQKLALEAQKKEQEFEILSKEKAIQEFSFRTKALEDQKALQESQLKTQRLDQEKILQELALQQFEITMNNQEQDKKEKQSKIRLLENEKKLLEKSESLQKSQILAQQNKEKSLKIIMALSGIILVSIVFGLIQFRNKNQILHKKQSEIEKVNADLEILNAQIINKNKSITDSINYAREIQEAFLPEQQKWNSIFPKSFILNKPKDIVSGDFYFLTQLDQKWILAVADCTGHGVPGALMSVMGHNLLVSATEVNGISDPAQILNQVNEGIRKTLKIKDFNLTDGMEMAICVFDFGLNTLAFASSMRPFFYLQNGELKEQKPTRKTLGMEMENIPFETSIFSLKDLDFIYLPTDGYSDQLGGEGKEKRRFLSKRLKNLLLEIHNNPVNQQVAILEKTMQDWMGTERQLDDMLIIGIDIRAVRNS